jgi:magnesium-transporting ATPase (P-type)
MIAFYNVAFTFLPPLCIGVFDRQVRNDTLMRVPQLYRAGLEGSFVCPCPYANVSLTARDE